jgi:hypothetical protein
MPITQDIYCMQCGRCVGFKLVADAVPAIYCKPCWSIVMKRLEDEDQSSRQYRAAARVK